MTGRFALAPAPHTHVTLHLDDGRAIHYVDPRRFGALYAASRDATLDGTDPFDPRFTPEWLASCLARTRRHLKAFPARSKTRRRRGQHLRIRGPTPRRPVAAPPRPPRRPARLHRAIVDVLGEAIAHGGTTLGDDSYVDVDGRRGRHQDFLRVYGRDACGTCGAPVRRFVQNARSTYSARAASGRSFCRPGRLYSQDV
jgi:formamidopyrimidine-DNA glycosylase